MLNIPLLPADSIVDGYRIIKRTARKLKLNNEFKALFQYFEDYWLNQNQKTTISVANVSQRITSPIEANNSVLNGSVFKHASFYKFIECLKQQEFSRASDMRAALDQLGKKNVRKRKRDQLRGEKIKKYSDLLRAKKLKLMVF